MSPTVAIIGTNAKGIIKTDKSPRDSEQALTNPKKRIRINTPPIILPIMIFFMQFLLNSAYAS
jgi:aspartokinase-like uncharacterized kinase